jgi:hypothetical protein
MRVARICSRGIGTMGAMLIVGKLIGRVDTRLLLAIGLGLTAWAFYGEHKSERSIRMTVSLAFVSPVLAKAAMEGRLARGFSVKRLTDLPMLWSEQWRSVGLREPIQVRAELG